MKTEQDVIAAINTLKEIIDKLMANLDRIEKTQKDNHDDIWRYEELEYDIKRLSYQIAFKRERLNALEWVLND